MKKYNKDQVLLKITNGTGGVCLHDLAEFLSENILIEEEKKWQPKDGYDYFAPAIDYGVVAYNIRTWLDEKCDRVLLAHNMVFKTKEEAEARSKEILELIKPKD